MKTAKTSELRERRKSTKSKLSDFEGRGSRTSKSKRFETRWREKLINKSIYNNDYYLYVIYIVERDYTDWLKIQKFIEKSENTKHINVITPQDIIKFAKEVGSRFQDQFLSHILYKSATIDLGNDIENNIDSLPTETLAALLKIRIISRIEEFEIKRENAKKVKEMYEKETEKFVAGEGKKKTKKKGGKSRSSSPNPKNKGKKGKKGNIKVGSNEFYLKKFIEDCETKTIINEEDILNIDVSSLDYNINRAYYIICGFYDPRLLEILREFDVDTLCFIEITSENITDKISFLEEVCDLSASATRIEKVNRFWYHWKLHKYDLNKLIPSNSCYLKFVPNNSDIFDDILLLLQNITNFQRLFLDYYSRVNFVNVKQFKPFAPIDCMKKYVQLMNKIPNECVTIPYLLDCLVEEVCAELEMSSDSYNEQFNTIPPPKEKFHGNITSQVKSMLYQYDCSCKNIQKPIEIPKTVRLFYGNVLEYTHGHLPNISNEAVTATLNILRKTLPMNVFKLIQNKNHCNLSLYNYLFTKWCEEYGNLTINQIKQCVFSYLFSRSNFKRIENNVKCPENNNKNIYNLNYLMFGIKKTFNEDEKSLEIYFHPQPIDKETENNENSNENFNSCDDITSDYCTLTEELDSAALIQMIDVAFNHYKHFDYKYFTPSDVILLRFHHNTNQFGIKNDVQNNYLGTTICFRDFCKNLLTFEIKWFIELEEEYWRKIYSEATIENPIVTDLNFMEENIIAMFPHEFKAKEKIEKGKKGKNKKRKSKNVQVVENNEKEEIVEKKRRSKDADVLDENVEQLEKDTHKNSKIALQKSIKNKIKYDPNYLASEKRINLNTPSYFLPFCPEKKYSFEIYNLYSRTLIFNDILTEFYSTDGVSVSLHKYNYARKQVMYSLNVSANDNTITLQFLYNNNIFMPTEPFQFHLNLVNGIVMVFSLPESPLALLRYSTNEKSNYIESEFIQSNVSKETSAIPNSSKQDNLDESTDNVESNNISLDRTNLLELLKVAVKNQMPVFKIISSRLHKYQYVKRVKSHIQLPTTKILKRVICKPILFRRLPIKKPKYKKKYIPANKFSKKNPIEMKLEWRASLPTGLTIQTVSPDAPNLFYIKQKYIIKRSDLTNIIEESYRCYLRNGIIMIFLKDGSIKTLNSDKSLTHFQFGHFSTKKPSITSFYNNNNIKKAMNIIPLHAYSKNLTKLEKKIKKICNKYKNHIIDISNNYHFERSRIECRRYRKIYNLSKKTYESQSHHISIINQETTTADGKQISVKGNTVTEDYKFIELHHKDYLQHEILLHRTDGTSWMLDKHGNAITQFPDGSRITTWYTVIDENFHLTAPVTKKNPNDLKVNSDKGLQTDLNEQKEENVLDEEVERKISPEPPPTLDETFIFLGINYKFEHPNYVTVTYYHDDKTEIKMPDDVSVQISKQGTYELKLLDNNIVDITNESIDFQVKSDDSKVTNCFINIAPLFFKRKYKDQLLYMKDSINKIFTIYYDGNIFKGFDHKLETEANESIYKSERLFTLRRDFTGQEYYQQPIPYKFVHTMGKMKEFVETPHFSNIFEDPVRTKIYRPLLKTYSEHLMMLYDVPVLATKDQLESIDKLCKLYDVDFNSFILKRQPRFIFERILIHLPCYEILEKIAHGTLRCLALGEEVITDLDDFKRVPKFKLDEDIIEKTLKRTKSDAEKKLKNKRLIKYYKKILKQNFIPPYFHTLKGIMFTTVEECSETAMELVDVNYNRNVVDVETPAPLKMKTAIYSMPKKVAPDAPLSAKKPVYDLNKNIEQTTMFNTPLVKKSSLYDLKKMAITRKTSEPAIHYKSLEEKQIPSTVASSEEYIPPQISKKQFHQNLLQAEPVEHIPVTPKAPVYGFQQKEEDTQRITRKTPVHDMGKTLGALQTELPFSEYEISPIEKLKKLESQASILEEELKSFYRDSVAPAFSSKTPTLEIRTEGTLEKELATVYRDSFMASKKDEIQTHKPIGDQKGVLHTLMQLQLQANVIGEQIQTLYRESMMKIGEDKDNIMSAVSILEKQAAELEEEITSIYRGSVMISPEKETTPKEEQEIATVYRDSFIVDPTTKIAPSPTTPTTTGEKDGVLLTLMNLQRQANIIGKQIAIIKESFTVATTKKDNIPKTPVGPKSKEEENEIEVALIFRDSFMNDPNAKVNIKKVFKPTTEQETILERLMQLQQQAAKIGKEIETVYKESFMFIPKITPKIKDTPNISEEKELALVYRDSYIEEPQSQLKQPKNVDVEDEDILLATIMRLQQKTHAINQQIENIYRESLIIYPTTARKEPIFPRVPDKLPSPKISDKPKSLKTDQETEIALIYRDSYIVDQNDEVKSPKKFPDLEQNALLASMMQLQQKTVKIEQKIETIYRESFMKIPQKTEKLEDIASEQELALIYRDSFMETAAAKMQLCDTVKPSVDKDAVLTRLMKLQQEAARIGRNIQSLYEESNKSKVKETFSQLQRRAVEIEEEITSIYNESFMQIPSIDTPNSPRLAAGGQYYPIKLSLPKDVKLTLQPENEVQEIVLSPSGMKIISENSTNQIVFREIKKSEKFSRKLKISTSDLTLKGSSTNKGPLRTWSSISATQNMTLNLPKENEENPTNDKTIQNPSNTKGPLLTWSDIQKANEIKKSSLNVQKKTISSESMNESCKCPTPSIKQQISKDICDCHIKYCTCNNPFSTCEFCTTNKKPKMSAFINILSWNIYEFFKNDSQKLSTLKKFLNPIINEINNSNDVSLSFIEKANLKKALKWIINCNEKKPKKLTQDEALKIIIQTRKIINNNITISKKISNLTELQINIYYNHIKYILFDNSQPDLSTKLNNIIKLLTNAPISKNDIFKILQISEENLITFFKEQLKKSFESHLLGDSRCDKIIKVINNLIDKTSEKMCMEEENFEAQKKVEEESIKIVPEICLE